MDRNYCLIVFIVCHTVIHRKLQNEYEKKIDVQKKKGGQHLKKKGGGNIGSCPHVPQGLVTIFPPSTLKTRVLRKKNKNR